MDLNPLPLMSSFPSTLLNGKIIENGYILFELIIQWLWASIFHAVNLTRKYHPPIITGEEGDL
jgi:hypothetical protein